MNLKDRVAVVTGGAQGIGRALAAGLAEAGAAVGLVDVLDAGPAAEEIVQSRGRAKAFSTDVSDESAVNEMMKGVETEFGRLDVLVNNAALFANLKRDQRFEDIPVDEWDRVMAVNVRGVFLCMKAAAPFMRKSGGGSIINFASDTVHKGVPGFLHYVFVQRRRDRDDPGGGPRVGGIRHPGQCHRTRIHDERCKRSPHGRPG